MIQVKNITKSFGGFQMKDLNVTFPDGYICGLVGRNGAGKTTLFHIMLDLYQVMEGCVEIDGLTYEDQEKEIKGSIGVVMDEDLLNKGLSLLDNGKYLGGYYKSFDLEKYRKLLKDFNLKEKASYGALSKGQMLKAQFAFALAINPKYLLLDEPTANFDPAFHKEFWKRLTEFVGDGERTVILSTHITDELDRRADYLVYLDQGEIVFEGDMESFRDTYRIASGEKSKLRWLDKKDLIYLEEKEYTSRALVRYCESTQYEKGIEFTPATIEEVMYFYAKRGNQ